jgi:heme/copper-type cytochrome/quinol oxidase subunit 2
MFINNFLITTCDSAERWQTGIQDPATPMLEGMLYFYNELMFYIVFIGIAVICMLYVLLTNFREENSKKAISSSHFSMWETFSSIKKKKPKQPLIINIKASRTSWACDYYYEATGIKKKVFLDRQILVIPYKTPVKIIFSSVDEVGHNLIVPKIKLHLYAPAGGSDETNLYIPRGFGGYHHPVVISKKDCVTKPTSILITSWDGFSIWILSDITDFKG